MNQQLITDVLSLPTLAPSHKTNDAFSRLVEGVVQTPQWDGVITEQILTLRRVCSEAESELETYWAKKIIGSSDPTVTLKQFPYYENYQELVRREIRCIEATGTAMNVSTQVLFIGAGPLPLTGFELIRQREVQLTHSDISEDAMTLCGDVSQKLAIDCRHQYGDGATTMFTGRYDVIYIAGLAGESITEKQAIIDNALRYLTPNGRIVIRSAWGARQLLYPAVEVSQLQGLELLYEYHPRDAVINSVLICKKEA